MNRVTDKGKLIGWRRFVPEIVHIAACVQQIILLVLAFPVLHAKIGQAGDFTEYTQDLLTWMAIIALGLVSLQLCEVLRRVTRHCMATDGLAKKLWAWHLPDPPFIVLAPEPAQPAGASPSDKGSYQPASTTPAA